MASGSPQIKGPNTLCSALYFMACVILQPGVSRPMASYDRVDHWLSVNLQQPRMKIRPGTTQVLPRATPSRHHRSQNLHCAGGIATPTPGTTKQVGKCLPVFMQTRPGTCFEQPLQTIVGTRQPALRVINDPDGGVAVGGDINQRAKRLSTRADLSGSSPDSGCSSPDESGLQHFQ